MMKERTLVKFASKGQAGFYDAVKQRVQQYFETTGLSPSADHTMVVKSVAVLALYVLPLLAIILGIGKISMVLFYLSWALVGLGTIGVGTCVMHDSNHGSYSRSKTVNYIMGGIINFMGAYSVNWRIQHNILHHTYTNISGLDDDIDVGNLLRMSPNQPRLPGHRWQHIYCWALYCIMNIFWVFVKDFKQAIQFNREGLLRKEKKTLGRALTEIALLRLVYFGYIIVLPILFSGVPWYHCVIGYLLAQVIIGFSLGCIFQPAHVMETSDYAAPTDSRKMENAWAVHQVLNTANFAPRNRFLTWFIGGLNRQIEHHLFPHICHVHYPALSTIVKETALEHGLPYHEYPTFRKALSAHYTMLKILGRGKERAGSSPSDTAPFTNSMEVADT
jgi:linoleoyl-CoA desaturase